MAIYRYEILNTAGLPIWVEYSVRDYTHAVVAFSFKSNSWQWDGAMFISEQRAITEAKKKNKNCYQDGVYVPTEVRKNYFCSTEQEYNTRRNAGEIKIGKVN
jgi:hypothetical protein